MIFLTGPRQTGKTWLARSELSRRACPQLYYNLDIARVSAAMSRDPAFFESDLRNCLADRVADVKPLLVFDEVHKRRRWKHELKGIFDEFHALSDIVVTGSARMDMGRRSGESLAGRYFLFHVYPLGVQELIGKVSLAPLPSELSAMLDVLSAQPTSNTVARDATEQLLTLGGYPDPLTVGELAYRRRWAADYQRLLLRDDLRDLAAVTELDRIETLWELLPERVGSPLSLQALSEILSAAHRSVRRWVQLFDSLYLVFQVRPWSKKLARVVTKERKVYLMDWALHNDEARRFENFVMSAWLRACTAWTEAGFGDYQLHFVRTRDAREADFLITRDGIPLWLGDAKLSDRSIDRYLYNLADKLGKIPVIQVTRQAGIFRREGTLGLRISADRLLAAMV